MALNERQAHEMMRAALRRMTPQEIYRELLNGYYPEELVREVLREVTQVSLQPMSKAS